MSCQRAFSRAGCRCWCWCCELAVHVVETGCWCWWGCWVPGAGAVSWLSTSLRQVAGAGAGCRVWCAGAGAGGGRRELAVHVVDTGCWCWVPGAGAGVGAVSWLRAWWCRCGWLCAWWRQVAGAVLVLGAGCRRWCCWLAVRVMETGCWCWVPGASVGAGAVSWLCTWWRRHQDNLHVLHCYRDCWMVVVNLTFTSTPTVYAGLEATPAFPYNFPTKQ